MNCGLTLDIRTGRAYTETLFSLLENRCRGNDLPNGLEDYLKKFYVKLPGSKRTKTIGAEVPVDYDRWLSELAASPMYPEYKTRSDIIRDCLHLGLSLRTDPRYRDDQDLVGIRHGIQALQEFERIANTRQTVDELVMGLNTVSPNTKAGQAALEDCKNFHANLDDPHLKEYLGSTIKSFKNRS